MPENVILWPREQARYATDDAVALFLDHHQVRIYAAEEAFKRGQFSDFPQYERTKGQQRCRKDRVPAYPQSITH